MSGVAGRKARNFQVVVHELARSGKWVVVSREKLLLVVVVRAPGQHRAHVHALATNLAHHVVGKHTLRRILIVPATRGVNVMISRIPAVFCRIDPALQLEIAFPTGSCHLP